MVYLRTGASADDSMEVSSYQTEYNKWNGFVSRIAVLRQITDIRAASVFSSWKVKGNHDKKATKMLSGMTGRNGESFKQIMASLYRVSYICGDAYAEIIFENDDTENGKIVNLKILPADNIRQNIEKGEIKSYEEINTGKKLAPYRILHIRYNTRGALTHGLGMIESLNNILLSYEQMLQLGQEIYEHMSRPREFLLANTDNKAKLDLIRDAVKEAGDSWSGIAVIPGTLLQDIKEFTLNPSLKPQEWLDTLSKEIFKATATPEIVLGTGYSTSEEDAKTRIAGFMGSIRYDQEMFEEDIRQQIFMQIWPEDPPEIEFTFTQEAYDSMYNRIMQAMPVIESLPSIAPENKQAIIAEMLEDMGLIT